MMSLSPPKPKEQQQINVVLIPLAVAAPADRTATAGTNHKITVAPTIAPIGVVGGSTKATDVTAASVCVAKPAPQQQPQEESLRPVFQNAMMVPTLVLPKSREAQQELDQVGGGVSSCLPATTTSASGHSPPIPSLTTFSATAAAPVPVIAAAAPPSSSIVSGPATVTVVAHSTPAPTGRLNKFVRRLHDMLQIEQGSGIVEWRRGLLVLHSTHTFAKRILPKYFNTKNFKTFRRQLNYYGFVHVRSFSTTGASTTALWVNKELTKQTESDDISSVLLLRRNEPTANGNGSGGNIDASTAKTAEGRRIRKEQAIHTVEEDLGVNAKTLQRDQILSMALRGTTVEGSGTEQPTQQQSHNVGILIAGSGGVLVPASPSSRRNGKAVSTTIDSIWTQQQEQVAAAAGRQRNDSNIKHFGGATGAVLPPVPLEISCRPLPDFTTCSSAGSNCSSSSISMAMSDCESSSTSSSNTTTTTTAMDTTVTMPSSCAAPVRATKTTGVTGTRAASGTDSGVLSRSSSSNPSMHSIHFHGSTESTSNMMKASMLSTTTTTMRMDRGGGDGKMNTNSDEDANSAASLLLLLSKAAAAVTTRASMES